MEYLDNRGSDNEGSTYLREHHQSLVMFYNVASMGLQGLYSTIPDLDFRYFLDFNKKLGKK